MSDAYLLLETPKFSASFRKRVVAPPKYHVVDNGLRRVVSPQAAPDHERRIENAVAVEFLRRGEAPCYAAERDSWECDFVTRGTVWQVCWQLDEENKTREIRGLLGAREQSRAKRMVILTRDQRQILRESGEVIEILPAWEWLG